MRPQLACEAQAQLGEGPAWDAKTNTLYWLDILGKRIHYRRTGENGFIQMDEMPGCLAPSKDGALLVAARKSILRLDLAQTQSKPAIVRQTVLASVNEPATNRFNDGKCDPAGRFVAGSMDIGEKKASGALYSFNGKEVRRLLDGIYISNGLAWSPDYNTFYYIDTPTRQVQAFDYDLPSGQIANSRVVIKVPETLGWPDGMTSDAQGCLWIAMWGGAQVTRWDPRTGSLLSQVPCPARNLTSCVFGGENLDELFVTSARVGLDKGDLEKYRLSGSVFCLKTKTRGMPTLEFG